MEDTEFLHPQLGKAKKQRLEYFMGEANTSMLLPNRNPTSSNTSAVAIKEGLPAPESALISGSRCR